MSIKESLSIRNCIRRPGRSAALTLLSMFLCFMVLAGSLALGGLQNGVTSLESRLGADIMVVPYEASTKSDLSNMILQGNPGYFYMDRSVVDKLKSIEGVGEITEQFFLASASSSCCSYKVQLIGFDPDTDFAITPWVKLTYKDDLEYMEVFVGNKLNAFAGDLLQFYGTTVRVAARLDETGTYMDTAIYANEDTIKTLISSAKESQIYDFGDVNPDSIVSCVLINVADGYSTEDVMNDINIHVRKVEAVQTQSMISDVSGKLEGVSGIAGGLITVIWILVFVIMVLAFAMMANERRKEFAVLRVIGSSRARLTAILIKESLVVSAFGGTTGAAAAVLAATMIGGFIEDTLSLPFLLPDIGALLVTALASIAATVLAAAAATAVSVMRISRGETALMLRDEN